jgi:acyl-CoA synthetase (AMP-forming)/AMP-acid ligase II/acyl carrier protein
VIDHLTANAHRFPDKNAYVVIQEGFQDRAISYAELISRVRVVAAGLRNRIARGERALLIYQEVLEFITAFLACQYAGVVAVPVPYLKGAKQLARLNHIARNAEVAAILSVSTSLEDIKKGLGEVLSDNRVMLLGTEGGEPAEMQPAVDVSCSDIAFIQYTSGSTGDPKGVVITHRNLNSNQHLIQQAFGCDEQSVIFSWLPFHHDMGLVGNLLHVLYTGSTCVLMAPLSFLQSPVVWLEGISRFKATHSGGPNFAYELCINRISDEALKGLDLSSWVVAYNGSEAIKPETMYRFATRFQSAGFRYGSFYPCYGLAEATLLVAARNRHLPPMTISAGEVVYGGANMLCPADTESLSTQQLVSSGEVQAGISCEIFSSDGRECADLEIGEICLAGESVSTGYWKVGAGDRYFLRKGRHFLRTGDLGFLHEGNLFVRGRIKEMLVMRGENYYPNDIEAAIANVHEALEPAGIAVFATGDSGDSYVIAAEMKRARRGDGDLGDCLRSIERMATGMTGLSPFDVLILPPMGLPRTTSGKLQRVKCRETYHEGLFTVLISKRGLALREEAVGRKSDLVADVLKLRTSEAIMPYLMNVIEAKVGRIERRKEVEDMHFSTLGLDSLRAAELINAVNRDLQINIDPSAALSGTNIKSLALSIEDILWLKSNQHSEKGVIV